MDIRKYLLSKNLQWNEQNRPSGLTAIMNCPFCDDREKKFAVKLDDGAFNCLHLNKCGVKGSFFDLQKLFGDKPIFSDNSIKFNTTKEIKKYIKPVVKTHGMTVSGAEFFLLRKISEKTISDFKITMKMDNNREPWVCFNYFKNGELVNIKYRNLSQEKKMYQEKNTEPTLYNMDSCNSDILYICEGEIDCMSLYEYGITGVSIPQGVKDTSWITEQWDFLNKFQKIFLIMDNDEAGQGCIKDIVNRLGAWRCYNVILPLKDINECLQNGIDREIIYQCILSAQEFNFDRLKTVREFRDDIIDVFENDEALHGIKTKYEGLNKIIKGWRNEVYIWTGNNGSGKTTFLNEVILDLINNYENICLFSLELPPKRLLRWLFIQYKKNDKLNRFEIDDCINYLSNKLWIYDSTNNLSKETMIDAMEFAVRKYNCRHFFIDSLMKIDLNYKYLYDEQKKILLDLCEFKKQFNCSVHLVAHPRKGQTDQDTPDKVDISGTADISNLADNVFSFYRLSEEKKQKVLDIGDIAPDNVLYIKKNREFGKEGSVKFKFIESSKNFYEM